MLRTPAVLIVAVPHVYATALASNLQQDESYEIVLPNVSYGDELPQAPFDVAITNLPIPRGCARVHIRLPETATDPLLVTAGETTVAMETDGPSYVSDLVALVKRYAFEIEPGTAPVL